MNEGLFEKEWQAELRQQQAILAAAKRRFGQIPSTRKSHQQLTGEHWQQQMQGEYLEAQANRHTMRNTTIGEAYSPSTAQIRDLQLIQIKELQLETHHRGKVLYVRTFCHPLQMSSIQSLVEDDQRTPEKLAVYHTHASTPMMKLLPCGAVFAIKEPYYKLAADGDPLIRVDHPSDLVYFHGGDLSIPPWFRLQPFRTALDHKTRGNLAYKAHDYFEAEAEYSLALRVCNQADQQVKRDVLRNRSLVDTYLQRYQFAEADASSSINPEAAVAGQQDRASNQKAFFRAGRATYELANFSAAREWFKKCLQIDKADVDAKRELERTSTRLQEELHGQYDFSVLSKSLSKKRPRCEVASYLKRTYVAESGLAGGGRGLYASQNIKAGDIVLCEKAFAIAFPADNETSTDFLLNTNTNTASVGTDVTLLRNVVRKVQHNEDLASRFFDLHARDYPAIIPRLVDGKVTVDAFQTLAVISRNGFGGPGVRSSDPDSAKTEEEAAFYGSSGIWIQASYINHACQSNAARAFLGDLMIVRATKEITKGAEIFMAHTTPGPNLLQNSKRTKQSWGFTCTCAVCAAELDVASGTKRRVDAIEAAAALCDSHPLKANNMPSAALVQKGERLYKAIEEAYAKPAFRNILPRLGLVPLGVWLLQASSPRHLISPQMIIDKGVRLLQHLGLRITVSKKNKLVVDRTQFVLMGAAVDIAMHVAHASQAMGGVQAGIGQEYIALAKEWHVTLKGEMRGFDGRYGE